MNITDKTGQRIPTFEFFMFIGDQWVSRTTEQLFGNSRVVVFAIPGAFSPVCSTQHLPRYNELYETFRSYGVEEVYCLAVNDSFVLNAWKKAERADNIVMLPDPDGEFTRRLGFLVNRNEVCLGNRSWRYSMVINNGIIEKMFIEKGDQGTDPYGESSAENMLKYLNPDAELPPSITIFSKVSCQVCAQIKSMLEQHHLQYEELHLNEEYTVKTAKALTGPADDLPVVFINGTKISKVEELEAYLSTLHPDQNFLRHFNPDERLLNT